MKLARRQFLQLAMGAALSRPRRALLGRKPIQRDR
jgi:hypothetical protein